MQGTPRPDGSEGEVNDERGWLIERHIQSDLHYWAGRSPSDWTKNNLGAVRFARQMDAALILSWLLGGVGNVTEHRWINTEQEIR